jgi:hypothetical protein
MVVDFSKININIKKFLFIVVPVIKIIKEFTNLNNAFYNVPNIFLQFFFLCVAKFANVIFWFILLKKIRLKNKKDKSSDEISKEIGNIGILPSDDDKLYSVEKKETKGLSQKEIVLNEIERRRKNKLRLEIFYLIISSIIDSISIFTYLVSYAILTNNNPNDYQKEENTEIDDLNFNNTTHNDTNINSDNNLIKDKAINLIPFRICLRIILIFIFSWAILKTQRPHRHQVVALLFTIIICICVYYLEYSMDIIILEENLLNNLLLTLFQEFFFSLDNVIGAKYLSISKGNIYKLLFFNGTFGIIMIIILSFSTSLLHCSKLSIDDKFCKDNDDKLRFIFNINSDLMKLIRFGGSLILTIVEMACTWSLVFYQTINHLSLACSLHLIFRFLIGRVDANTNHIIIGIISFILICFMTLLFNEVIIIRFFGLEKNTTKEIELRAIEDKNLMERTQTESNFDGRTSEL